MQENNTICLNYKVREVILKIVIIDNKIVIIDHNLPIIIKLVTILIIYNGLMGYLKNILK